MVVCGWTWTLDITDTNNTHTHRRRYVRLIQNDQRPTTAMSSSCSSLSCSYQCAKAKNWLPASFFPIFWWVGLICMEIFIILLCVVVAAKRLSFADCSIFIFGSVDAMRSLAVRRPSVYPEFIGGTPRNLLDHEFFLSFSVFSFFFIATLINVNEVVGCKRFGWHFPTTTTSTQPSQNIQRTNEAEIIKRSVKNDRNMEWSAMYRGNNGGTNSCDLLIQLNGAI